MTSSSGCRAANRERKAFTLIELIVVISIVMILGGAALSSGSGVVKSMRFNSAFDTIVTLTQRARNRAVNETRAGETNQYAVLFDKTNDAAQSATLFNDKNGDKQISAGETIDSLRLVNTTDIIFSLEANQGQRCLSSAIILFSNEAKNISLYCDGSNDANKKNRMRIGVRQNTGNREKTFSINSEAGIAQL